MTNEGDVLNTTARIQKESNRYKPDCLVSGPLINPLTQMNGFQWERVYTVLLRKKETELELFSVMNDQPKSDYCEVIAQGITSIGIDRTK